MEIIFKNLLFEISGSKVVLQKYCDFINMSDNGFLEVHISGENKATHEGIKLTNSSEGKKLRYISHVQNKDTLSIVQESGLVRTNTVFTAYDNTNAVSIYTEVTNISDNDIVLEDVSSLVVGGLSSGGVSDVSGMFITKFIQSHHSECQPRRFSFEQLGFDSQKDKRPSQKRIAFANIGSWSTKEEIPQAIVEDSAKGQMLMFQIESSNSWYYEISDRGNDIYLYLGGANGTHHCWCKKLYPGQSYTTPRVAIASGNNLNDILANITNYRRQVSGLSEPDKNLPTIFNEYMHLTWDSPSEEITKSIAPAVAKTGTEYYVIDCGWHDEEPGNIIYHYVGKWKESKTRYPHGLRTTTDYIRSLGMKAGLWIEPEIVGVKCQEMLDYYDDDCFFQRYGNKVAVHDRYFLDYRNPKVVSYMTETIRRMVEDYGADYIKFDYNQDCGIGTDLNCDSFSDGLEKCNAAFYGWVQAMKSRFPNVIFEGCASGGMRMDYKTLSTFSLISTSDQTNYIKYPYIASNILSAVIPEQAAVWSYPVAWQKKENISLSCTAMNMINSFLGRIHLASHIDWLDDENKNLVSEGVEYFKKLSLIKKEAVPYLPLGFSNFGQSIVASGLKHKNNIYLAVWNLEDVNFAKIDLGYSIVDARIAYPCNSASDISIKQNSLEIQFESEKIALFLEIEIDERVKL